MHQASVEKLGKYMFEKNTSKLSIVFDRQKVNLYKIYQTDKRLSRSSLGALCFMNAHEPQSQTFTEEHIAGLVLPVG